MGQQGLQLGYLDNEETRNAQRMIAWADEKIAAAKAGEIFNVSVGHDEFLNRVYAVREENEDILLRHACLHVTA